MELTGDEMILTFEELWAIVTEYVIHLRTHNQTSKLEELFDSLHQHKEYYGRGLRPMLDMMSKYGMPHQFPKDGSHFLEEDSFQCEQNLTSSLDNQLIETSKYW